MSTTEIQLFNNIHDTVMPIVRDSTLTFNHTFNEIKLEAKIENKKVHAQLDIAIQNLQKLVSFEVKKQNVSGKVTVTFKI